MSGKELPKVIDKSQADIDAAIAAIQSTDLPSTTKEFAISCIKLAVWLPKALLEQKIKLSNLRKLIFGQGKRSNRNREANKETALQKMSLNNQPTMLSWHHRARRMRYPVVASYIGMNPVYWCVSKGRI